MKKNQKDKVNNRKIVIRIGAILVLVVSIYFLTTVFSFKSPHGINQIEGLYWQPKDSIDVVMMGTSHIHCGVNTGILWEKYGIPAYDYSGAEQPLWMTYYYLKEIYKYQSPDVIVLDLYAPARYKEDYQYNWIGENIYGMRFSFNKLAMLFASVEMYKISDYFPSFTVYHSRYGDLEQEDFSNFFWESKDKEAFKGYTPYWGKALLEEPERDEIANDETVGLTEKSEKYLRKIIQYTKEKGSQLIFIVVPYEETKEDRKTYEQVETIALKEGIPFINFNALYDEMKLDFASDFHDASHLNYWGSCKFTECLGQYLSLQEGIVNRNHEEGYESWNDNVVLIQEEYEMAVEQ